MSMNFVAQFGGRLFLRPLCCSQLVYKAFCSYSSCSDTDDSTSSGNGFDRIEKLIRESCKVSDFDKIMESSDDDDDDEKEKEKRGDCSSRNFFESTYDNADRLFNILRQDGPGFNVKSGLDELNIRISAVIVRQVLLKILKIIDHENRTVCSRLAYKFFVWSSEQEHYRHTVNAYHLLMKIFVKTEEFKAMWRLADEMTEKGYPSTARTFNILICCCREVGLQRTLVEKFVKSKNFNYRPFRNSYNAIMLSLLNVHQHMLVEWVYREMLSDRHSPDVLTYNLVICAQYRQGKLDHVHRLLDEMGKAGFSPDCHTYNILLHILGKGHRPLAALHLLNHMREVRIHPSSLHFTTLIDGLSRFGDMEACEYFFDEMVKNEVKPDVACYTVMINGYIAKGDLEKAQKVFDEMIVDGQLPNVFTYNSMIRGLCIAKRFKEAKRMLKEMEKNGCTPNFPVYNTFIHNLRQAGRHSEAYEFTKDMIEKGKYVHRLSRLRKYRKR